MRRRFMRRTTQGIDVLLAQLPAGHPLRTRAHERARSYNRDCGCALGAASLAVALPVAAAYVALTAPGVPGALESLAFVFVATVAGKAAGLVIASLRLALLRRSLARTLEVEGMEARYVDVH